MTEKKTHIRLAIPPGTPEAKCRSPRCGQTIYFVPSGQIDLTNGRIKSIPVDGDGTPHWATCCDADAFRKSKRQERGNR